MNTFLVLLDSWTEVANNMENSTLELYYIPRKFLIGFHIDCHNSNKTQACTEVSKKQEILSSVGERKSN